MPIFDQGYRPYEGERKTRGLRWWPITRACFRTSIGWPFFLVLVVGAFPLMFRLIEAYATGAGSTLIPGFRTRWGFGDGLFFELISAETFIVVLLLSVTGAGQISEDFRSGALQIYFSRPIRQTDYVLGKLGAVMLFAFLLTLAPGLILLAACAAFAPDFSFLTENPLLPLKIIAFSLVISLTLGSIVLALSSLGRRGRLVGLTFAGGYFFTMVLSKVLPKIFHDSRWEVVHLGRCLDAVGRTIFLEGSPVYAPPELAFGILASLTTLSLVLLARRVDAVEVVS
jgi:ABC-2 type transport system permease protein